MNQVPYQHIHLYVYETRFLLKIVTLFVGEFHQDPYIYHFYSFLRNRCGMVVLFFGQKQRCFFPQVTMDTAQVQDEALVEKAGRRFEKKKGRFEGKISLTKWIYLR